MNNYLRNFVLTLFFMFCINVSGFPQVFNASSFDDTDYKIILKEQGIDFFKTQLHVERGEYIDISIEVYEKGKLIENFNLLQNLISGLEKAFGSVISLNYHVSKVDTTIYHRFYFFKQNDSLKIVINVPGVKAPFKYNISKIGISDLYPIPKVSTILDKKTPLGFYYATFNDNNDGLSSPSGLSIEKVISKFDLVIMI